jgi:hypothetical protein
MMLSENRATLFGIMLRQATFRGCSMPGCSTVSMCETMVLRAKQ